MSQPEVASTPHRSILFHPEEQTPLAQQPPPYFADLNLDQVVESVTATRAEYDLKPYFYTRLASRAAITYRHEVLQDLESDMLVSHLGAFAQCMREQRNDLDRARSCRYRYEEEAWLLHAARTYCAAVKGLAGELATQTLTSRGFRAIRDYLANYAESTGFRTLIADTEKTQELLSGVVYCLNIKGSRIKVSRFEGQDDYSAEVEQTFEKFRQGSVKDYRNPFPASTSINHVEAQVLDLVARLYPDVFSPLDDYCQRHRVFLDDTLGTFDREVQFYMAYLDYIKPFVAVGLPFCYPQITEGAHTLRAEEAFDLALANKLVPDDSPVVCNDFFLEGPERIIVVSGPNQGGKTTFARTFGQLHHMAAIGCPVPAKQAQVILIDQLFSHFEKEEDLTDLSGKLENDLRRIREILEHVTAHSVVIMNESLTSTTLKDARTLGTAVIEQLIERSVLCVYVTFVDELASLGEETVSMTSTVVPDEPASRTYKIVRRPADGLAYAAAIADKYGLTYRRLTNRIAS